MTHGDYYRFNNHGVEEYAERNGQTCVQVGERWDDPDERGEMVRVRFDDGFEIKAFADELERGVP